jgi:protoporphyrinogen oxidase
MKTYNNGPRKGMMYGGMTRRKPMMYGGTANQMSAKKAKGQQMPREERKSKNVEPAMGMPKMAGGGRLKEPDNPGLKKLPKKVRNRMGFKAEGGEVNMSNVPDELKSAFEIIMKKRKTKGLTKQEQKEVNAMIDEMLGRKEIN